MTTREFILAVQNELTQEGFTIISQYSLSRFGAKDYDGTLYEIHVKYCVKPRVLHTAEIGYMSCFQIEDATKLFITNGIGLTTYAQSIIEDSNKAKAILNWAPGKQIVREPGSVHVAVESKSDNTNILTLKQRKKPAPNGFAMMADTYRQRASEGLISVPDAEKKCKAFDFLKDCDKEDICNLFDSSAFNEIAKSYLRLAVKELIAEGKLNEDQGKAVRSRFSLLFDEKNAKDVLT